MRHIKISKKNLAQALALALSGAFSTIGCAGQNPSTALDNVAMARAMNGDHKIASKFASCNLAYDVIQCKKDALK